MISQITKREPNRQIAAWLESQEETDLYLSVITLLEIRLGVDLLPAGKKRGAVERWFVEDLPIRMNGRVLPINEDVADLTGSILARSRQEGWAMQSLDALIGATAMAYGMQLATLNRRHFSRLGIELVVF